jgi:hypothetical protein
MDKGERSGNLVAATADLEIPLWREAVKKA